MDGSSKKINKNKKEFLRALKYLLFSTSAGVIQMVSALLLKLVILDWCIPKDATINFIIEQPLETFIAETVGLALSILWNVTFNRKFTFKAANNVPIAMLLAFVFYIPFYPFQTWYIATVEKSLGNIGDWAFVIAQGTCMIINFVLEFLWQTFVVFRGAKDTNDLAKKEEKKNDEQNDENVTEQANLLDTSVNGEKSKTKVNVILIAAGEKVDDVIDTVSKVTNQDIALAKKFVQNAPVIIAENKLKEEADKIAEELKKVGATVELK